MSVQPLPPCGWVGWVGQWLLRSPISFPNVPRDFGENEGCLARECHGRQRLMLPRSNEVAGITTFQLFTSHSSLVEPQLIPLLQRGKLRPRIVGHLPVSHNILGSGFKPRLPDPGLGESDYCLISSPARLWDSKNTLFILMPSCLPHQEFCSTHQLP